ncbi:MAG TPA: acyltransferase family protein [Pseudolabrys sp.]|nr:acyltransferase family protein [Pseudolabrys sp.]
MSVVSEIPSPRPAPAAVSVRPIDRDRSIDTMRGIAILMVIGIHALHAQAFGSLAILADAAFRPCVPIFLFASGYLTARSGHVSLGRRIKAVLPPYIVAFVTAYIYMALHNPAMDHRALVTVARFGFAYVFVYYYVFVYLGCTVALWAVFRLGHTENSDKAALVALLLAAIVVGLTAGAYLDPLLARFHVPDNIIEEARLRDIPFWFTFTAAGALVGLWNGRSFLTHHMHLLLPLALAAYAAYALVRLFGIGDAAAYDSAAFFLFATTLCLALLGLHLDSAALAALGSGSYFIYLWHIFIVLIIRDHTELQSTGGAANFVTVYAVTLFITAALLFAIRRLDMPLLTRWSGA